jgi:hypothetical protein
MIYANAAQRIRGASPHNPSSKIVHGVIWLSSDGSRAAAGESLAHGFLKIVAVIRRLRHGTLPCTFDPPDRRRAPRSPPGALAVILQDQDSSLSLSLHSEVIRSISADNILLSRGCRWHSNGTQPAAWFTETEVASRQFYFWVPYRTVPLTYRTGTDHGIR